jgi:tRNA threonylcarbamoyl adenosine modification protein YeaZ
MWLALETSSDRASVALGRPGAVTAEAGLEGARKHAGALPGLIDQVLSEAGTDLSALEAVVLGDGPGSFTGLRVGAAVAKALVRSHGLALHAIPSLVAVAWSARPSPEDRVLAVGNALRGEVYAAEYRFPAGTVEVLQAPAVWLPERLLADCPVPDIVSGALPEGLAERLAEWQSGRHPRTVPGIATAGALLELAARRGGIAHIADPAGWQPVYGRPAEAQAKWEREHGHTLPDSPGQFR